MARPEDQDFLNFSLHLFPKVLLSILFILLFFSVLKSVHIKFDLSATISQRSDAFFFEPQKAPLRRQWDDMPW